MRYLSLFLLVCVFAVFISGSAYCSETGGWPGVDETVVGRFAEQGGRPAKGCILELTGDAQLFAFLCAGLVGGFAIGYYYRGFVSSGRRPGEEENGENRDAH